jgi:hypothetical protein
LSKTGMSCFETALVIGHNREPVPPARMMPRMDGQRTRASVATTSPGRNRAAAGIGHTGLWFVTPDAGS